MTQEGGDNKITKGLQSAKDALSEKMVQLAHKDSEDKPPETLYNVVFTGKFTKNQQQTIAAMAKFFKQGQEATKRLLQPGRVIKSFPNKAPADKLLKMLANVGLECKVEMEVVGEERESSLLEKAAFKLEETKIPDIHLPNPKELKKNQIYGLAAGAVVVLALALWLMLKPPVVEGNSFATFEASVSKVLGSCSDEERPKVEKAIALLTGAGFEYQKQNTGGGNEEVAANLAYGAIKGLNAKGIMAAAEAELERKKQWFQDEIATAKAERDTQQAEIDSLLPQNSELQKLAISEEKFYWVKGNLPEIHFKLTNNSADTLHRIFFQGYLYDENGSELVSKDFSFTIAVGLKPGNAKYVPLFTKTSDLWANPDFKEKWRSLTFKATVEQAENKQYKTMGVDLRPQRQKVALAEQRIKDLETKLAEIKL